MIGLEDLSVLRIVYQKQAAVLQYLHVLCQE